MKNKISYFGFTFLIFQLIFSSCDLADSLTNPTKKDEIVLNPTVEGGLVSYEKVKSVSLSSIQGSANLAAILGISLDPTKIKYGVDLYKIEYMVNYKGNLTKASGLLCLPNDPTISTIKPLSAYSFQHGTILKKTEAPTLNLDDNLLPVELFVPAAMGMMAVMPDYIGFGSSANEFHPYYVGEPSSKAVLGLLSAAKNLSTQLKYTIGDQLFLVGYSQGGYVTLATHQSLSKTPSTAGFTNFTSFAAAGGYDLLKMQELMLTATTYPQPFYLAYVLKAYQTYYGISQPGWGDILNPDYAGKIDGLLDGTKTGAEVNAALTSDVATLMKANFIANYNSDPVFSNLKNKLTENSLVSTVSSKPLYLYHGVSDKYVFYSTSIRTKELLEAAGATNIDFIPLLGDHNTAFIPFANDVFQKIVQSL